MNHQDLGTHEFNVCVRDFGLSAKPESSYRRTASAHIIDAAMARRWFEKDATESFHEVCIRCPTLELYLLMQSLANQYGRNNRVFAQQMLGNRIIMQEMKCLIGSHTIMCILFEDGK